MVLVRTRYVAQEDDTDSATETETRTRGSVSSVAGDPGRFGGEGPGRGDRARLPGSCPALRWPLLRTSLSFLNTVAPAARQLQTKRSTRYTSLSTPLCASHTSYTVLYKFTVGAKIVPRCPWYVALKIHTWGGIELKSPFPNICTEPLPP